MADSILKKHQLDITVGVELNDAQRKATSTQIKNMASQWQDILDDAIKKGIEDGARSASLKDVLTQFNAQLKAFKLEPLTITVDELQIMDKPIEHAAKLVIQKLGDSFKGGGLGNIISSEITDSLDIIGGAVDKIYQKMEQGAKKSANNIAKSMREITTAAEKYSKKTSMQEIDKAIRAGVKKDKAEQNATGFFKESASARKSGASWDEQYLADVKFVRNYEKVAESGTDALKRVFGDQFEQVEKYYNNLAKVHQQKIIALNDILAQNEFVGGTKKTPVQYQFKGGEPWAREKTLQEVKNILRGGLTVKDSGDGSNINTINPQIITEKETELQQTIQARMDAEKRAKEAADAIALVQEKMQKQGFAVYRGINEEDAAESREDGQWEYSAEYWAKDKKTALSYAVGSEDDTHTQLLKTIASPKNPLVLDAENHEYSNIKDMTALVSTLQELGMDVKSLLADGDSPDAIQQKINEFAKSKGYDSVITNNVKDANIEGAPITSTVAVLDDSILSTIQAFDVIEGELQATATKIAEWYHAPDQSKATKIDGAANEDLETELTRLRQEQEAATKEVNQYAKKEEKQKKELEKIQSKLPTKTDDVSEALTTKGDQPETIKQEADAYKEVADAVREENEELKENIALVQLLHELNSKSNGKEVGTFIDTTSGKYLPIPDATDEHSVITKLSDWEGASASGYKGRIHKHNNDIAVPSFTGKVNDFDTWIKGFDYIKQQFILANKEILAFDFSSISKETLQNIYNLYKQAAKPIMDEFRSINGIESQKRFGGKNMTEAFALRDQAMNVEVRSALENIMQKFPNIMRSYTIDEFTKHFVEPQVSKDGVSKSIIEDNNNNNSSTDLTILNETLSNLVTALNKEKPDATATINTEELGSVLHDGRPYLVDVNGKSEDVDSNKVSIDTEGLQGVLTAITFKVQDVSEKEQANSAIDQESINSLVSAIKTAITPQSDGESKSTAPWAKEDTLRNITGKTLGKIANSIPKVDVKGLATNDMLNRVAQATEAINNKISGRISGDINGPAAAQKSQLFDAKVQSRVSALQTKYTKLDASGQLTPEISDKIMGLWDNLDQVKTQPEFSLWLQQLKQVENEIQQIITLNKLNEQETKDSVGEIIAITKQYHDALIRAEKAKNPELQQFWTDEANKAWAEQERMQQDIEAETGKRVDLTKMEIKLEQQLGAIRADKAGKAKAAQEKKDLVDHNNAVQKLIDDYEELGRLRAQRDAMPRGSTERTALSQDIKARSGKLSRQGAKLGVNTDAMKNIADMAQNEEAAAIATRKHNEEYDKLIAKIKERNKEQEKLAGADKDSKFAKDVQARIDGMNGEIDLIQQKIKLTKEEQAEVDKLNAKRDNAVNDKQNKKQDQADAKKLREEIKEARKQNNLDIADSTYNSARKTMASLWQLDPGIDPQSIPQVQALQVEMTKLDAIYKQVNDKVREGQSLSDEEIRDLQDTSAATAQKIAQLKELIKNYTDLQNGEEIGQYVGGAGSEQEQLQKAINDRFGGKAKIKEYRQHADGTLTAVASVKTGTRAFTEYTVAVSQADKKIKMLTGTTKQLPGFFDNVKKKFYEITQYVSAMSLISRATQELRKGIQYVRDIDLALTELKKVTDETEETYDKFLDTASKTAAKVGSTIKDVISSTADWARLGYSMEQAAKFAESTQILMNVSEFTDVSRATDTLISAVQAFGYTADTSMEVVDLLNTIGKIILPRLYSNM